MKKRQREKKNHNYFNVITDSIKAQRFGLKESLILFSFEIFKMSLLFDAYESSRILRDKLVF